MSNKEIKTEDILTLLPKGLRDELIQAYNNILKNFREHRWEPSELNGGKLCEIAHTILRGHVDGKYPSKSTKPSNMVDACKDLEKAGTHFPRSVRIQIPRILIALYEIRNNRGVGHVGGDVNPNHMDATAVVYMSKWVVAELIRLFHNVDPLIANAAVDSLVQKIIPAVWIVDGKYRALDTTLSMKSKTLLFLYQHSTPVRESELLDWVEHSNPSVYRKDILEKAHKERLLEYNSKDRTVQISPKGIQEVENTISLTL